MRIPLMGMEEIISRLGGISAQRAQQLTSRPDFPKACATLAQGRLWRRADVEAWLRANRPSTRRPYKSPSSSFSCTRG
jgi:prophage regulatory protein